MLRMILISLTLGLVSNVARAENSSQAARKKLYLQLETHLGANGSGGGVGIFLPGDTRLDFSYTEDFIDFEDYKATQRNYRVELQSFLSNSFYYTLGVTHRRFDFKIDDFYYIDDPSDSIHSHIESNGLHMAIGNEWQWSHFFIGAEWIGFMKPLAWSYENEYDEGVSDDSKISWEHDAKKLANTPNAITLNLFLGFSF